MKIEILSIQNLNSLSGKSELNFTAEPFNGSGLFAITGPTGAGKSTIFDAICLALYGRTPRLKNPDEIMSRHSSECYTELTFSVNSKRYRSRWEQRRSRGNTEGKLQSAKMFVIDLNGNEDSIIEDKKSAVPLLIAKLTGLDYDQFTRSILLAQGNFASFLRAGVNERADLLEKMTGSEIYTRLSIEAFNRSKTEDEKLERLKEKLGDTELLNIEDVKEFRTDKNWKLNRREEIRKEIETLTENQKWLEQEVILKYKLDSAKYDLHESLVKEKDTDSLKNDLNRINRILEYLPVYENHNQIRDNLEKKNKEQASLRAEISTVEKKVVDRTIIVETDKKSLDHSHIQIAEIQQKINSARISRERINNINIQLEQNRNQIKSNNIEFEDIQKHFQILSREQDKVLNKEKAIRDYLERNKKFSKIKELLPILKDKYNRYTSLTSADILDREDITSEKIEQLKIEMENKGKEIKLLDKNISLLKSNKPGVRSDFEGIKEILLKLIPVSKNYHETNKQNANYSKDKLYYTEKSKEISSALKNVQSIYEEIKENHNKLSLSNLAASIEDHLHDGDLCPVCSGTYHKKHNKLQGITDSFLESEKKMEKLLLEMQKLEKEKNNLENKIISITETIDSNNERILAITDEWNEIKGDFLPELHPDNKDEANSYYLRNEKKLKFFNDWEKNYHLLIEEERRKKDDYSQFKRDFDSLNEHFQNQKEVKEISIFLEEEIAPFNVSLNQKDFIPILERYYSAFDEKLSEWEVLKSESNNNDKKHNQSRILLDQLRLRLEVLKKEADQLEINFKNEDSLLKSFLRGKSIESLEDSIRNLRIGIEKKLENDNAILSEFREQLSQLKGKLENLQEEIPLLTEQFQNIRIQLRKIMERNNFTAEDFNSTDLRQRADQLSEEINVLHERRIRAEEIYNKGLTEVEKHAKNCNSTLSLSEISDTLRQFNNEIEELSRTIGIIDEKLEDDDKKRNQVKDLSLLIEKQEIDCLKWSRVKNLIGSADGKSYRRFVQGLTLEKLVLLANKHLIRLNNRYKIERSDDKELEIVIIDCWQADTIRPAITLSGGESFLVSLALSLGLSELVGNKVVIDSLFLDEGFGTLDPDALETVLSALETLQSSGKLIGIISHVEAIRERISVQIKVRKLAGGRSTIEIV